LVSTLGLSSQVRTQTGTARRLPAKRSTDATMELHNQAANLTPQHLALKTNSHERLPHWGVTTILSQNSFLQALGEQRDPLEYEPVRASESMLATQKGHGRTDLFGGRPFNRLTSDATKEFICDGCDMDLHEGVRYSSLDVADFDLCSSCFAQHKHDKSHGPFIPLGIETSVCCGSDIFHEDNPMHGLQGEQLYWAQHSGRMQDRSSSSHTGNDWESVDVGRATGLIFAENGHE